MRMVSELSPAHLSFKCFNISAEQHFASCSKMKKRAQKYTSKLNKSKTFFTISKFEAEKRRFVRDICTVKTVLHNTKWYLVVIRKWHYAVIR